MESTAPIYKVQLSNENNNGGSRHYSIFSAAPSIKAKGLQADEIRQTICYRTENSLSYHGEDSFDFSYEYYAFVGLVLERNIVSRIDMRHAKAVRLGEQTNNGSYVTAQCINGFSIRDVEASATSHPGTLRSPTGTFTIHCIDAPGPGHNVVVGLAQNINGSKVVIAAVDYRYNAVFEIQPSHRFRIRLQHGDVGEIMTDFEHSARITFRANSTRVAVKEDSDGNFTSFDGLGIVPLPKDPGIQRKDRLEPQQRRTPRIAAPNQTRLAFRTENPNTFNPPPPPPTARETKLAEEGEGDEDEDEDADEESPYENLREFDTVFVIDDSGSMKGSSWRETRQVLQTIAKICTQYGRDGIDIYFLNHRSTQLADPRKGRSSGGYLCVTTEDEVFQVFRSVRPRGGTPTGRRLRNILQVYLGMYEENVKQYIDSTRLNVIVITDGHPSDDVEAEIAWAAKKLDRFDAPSDQVGIQFFQVGHRDGASRALRELHERICARDIRDIVDTVTWDILDGTRPALTPEGILRTVTGAFERKGQRHGA